MSLLELIISLAVFSSIAGLLFGIFFVSFRVLSIGERKQSVSSESAWALERMVKEFRQAYNIYAIEEVTNRYRIEFELLTTGGIKRYKYYLSGTDLLRAETTDGWTEGEGRPIAKMVTDFQLSFYDRNNNKINNPPEMESEVSEIEMYIKVSKEAPMQGAEDIELRTRVNGRRL